MSFVPVSPVSIKEAVQLGAVDSIFYSHFFFPRTFRQASPKFHREVWKELEDQNNRYVAMKIFRDGAKTTLLRAFSSKMVAYGFSRTILLIGKSEAAARRSARWLMKQVKYNRLWADTFSLSPGEKWTEEHFEIKHGIDEHPISIVSFGMTGSIRGINLEDYRPDLVIVDDPCDSENTATNEQRKKTEDLLFADVQKTLAPRSEAPHAKMILLQTPLARGDAIDLCSKDPEWSSLIFGCFDEGNKSRWEVRWPTSELVKDKESHIRRSQLSLWMREKECKIISTELAAFRAENLEMYEVLPTGGTFIMAIDPASSDAKSADPMAMGVLYFHRSDVYVVDYRLFKGYDFDLLATEFFAFIRLYRPRLVVVESVSYQRTLIWHLRREMENRRIFVTISPVEDRRAKGDRIIQALGGLSGFRHLKVRPTHTEFIQQFSEWGPTVKIHDDLLDMVAMAVTASNPALDGVLLQGEYERIEEEEKGLLPIEIAEAP